MHQLRQPTEKQKEPANSLGINTGGKSFRVLSAEIGDVLELKSFASVEKTRIKAVTEVKYIGYRDDMPQKLIVSSVGKNGYLYFKDTAKYCRPWDVEPISNDIFN